MQDITHALRTPTDATPYMQPFGLYPVPHNGGSDYSQPRSR
jgi:hypothetical protein